MSHFLDYTQTAVSWVWLKKWPVILKS